MRRAAWVTLLASMASGTALAQGAPAQTGGDGRWWVSAELLYAWFKSSPTPVPIITDSYADAPGVNVLLGTITTSSPYNPPTTSDIWNTTLP